MMKTIFSKIIGVIIMSLFLITSLLPIIESNALTDNDTTSSTLCSLEQQHPDNQRLEKRPIDGLAPKTRQLQKAPSNQRGILDRGYFYAYNAYDPSGGHPTGPITFDTPDAITVLAPGVFPNFCGGADMNNDLPGGWYGCDYAGGLYQIDPNTGAQTYIGSTIGVNGMTYDRTTDTWYVTSSNNLYTMDVTTGATILIGPHGVLNTFIGIACDIQGNMYGYDVLWTGDSTLYSIDKTTGVATAIGSMGYGFVYAQDCGFDRDYDILYIAGYFNDGSPSALLTCDTTTSTCTIVGNFEGGMEVDGLAIPWLCCGSDHDIAINSIMQPINGNAAPLNPIVRVKNAGLNIETNVTVQLMIGKELVNGTLEDFEATNGSYIHYPKIPQPDAWAWGAPASGPMAAHSGNNVWATNLAGNYPPSMWCILQTTPFVVPSGALFNFWHWYYFENNYDGGNVKISNDGGATYTIINPEGGYPGAMPYNAFMTGQPAFNGQSGEWKQANFDLSTYEGQTVQIIFETASDGSVQYPGWYIDDVGFTITSWANEYNQTTIIPIIASDEVIDLSFPTWTPADLGISENININYNAEATGLLVGDQNPNNDYKSKLFTLHYGFLHDVAVTEIVSPHSGLAQTQTPEVIIENPGQNPENINVQMTIGKAQYTTLLEEDFATGVPPAGWGTNYPENWMSSSTNYAGGGAPEAMFQWTPQSVGEHLLYTGMINTTGYTTLLLSFKEYVNDYNGNYDLKVVTSIDGGATWNDAYTRAGGLYGPTTTELALTSENGIGSATFQIAWDMSGDSFNINYWYIDDVFLGIIEMEEEYNETSTVIINPGTSLSIFLPEWTPADIPFATEIDYLIDAFVSLNLTDGDPANNHCSTLITLSYEHDVGVIEITEPHESAFPPKDEGWLQYDNGVYSNAFGSTTGHIYTANRFTIDEVGAYIGWKVDTIMFKHYGAESFSGTVRIYDAGSATAPGPMLTSEPFSITGAGWFNVTLTIPITITGSDIWLGAEGTHATGLYPFECSSPGISGKSAFFSSDDAVWYDLPSLGYDVAWELRGHVQTSSDVHLFPGTYPIEGFVKNLGVTYNETDIPLNTQIKFLETGEIIYDEDVILPGSIEPGHIALASFPIVTFPNEHEWEGWYKLEMKTMLPNDDHPSNDKKGLIFYLYYIYIPPLVTTATVSGTMGENDWYVSNVTIVLTAMGGWLPVNHTYYKIDSGDWIEYFEPFSVSKDGDHTVFFYSVDTGGNSEDQKSVSFKIDQTNPSIMMSAEKVGFRQWLFTASTSDETSGIVAVQCYLDDQLLGNIITPGPYQWNWTGKGNHTVTGVAYDHAGNSAENNVVFSYTTNQFSHQQPRILTLLEKIIQMILSHLPFTLRIS